jgi:hypothetical protein
MIGLWFLVYIYPLNYNLHSYFLLPTSYLLPPTSYFITSSTLYIFPTNEEDGPL